MISLNEGHNLRSSLENLSGWANEVFLLDSCSADDTIDIALEFGINVFQRDFRGFGDQWNFAINQLPIQSPWTMKLDPDERLTEKLKVDLVRITENIDVKGIIIERRLWFMQKTLPVKQSLLRVWKTGSCRFSDVPVNEYPLVDGKVCRASGHIEHHDSPNLDHWITKQNKYTTAEAINSARRGLLTCEPKLLGSALERRMWLKKYFWYFPLRYKVLFIYHYIWLGAFKAGTVGWIWSHLRVEVYRTWEYKTYEIETTGSIPQKIPANPTAPDSRVTYFNY
jgi:glycosyltransferase involved in cell wall biosynthesis